MKQLLLNTDYIIPTGDKKQPVIVKQTRAAMIIKLLTGCFFLAAAILMWNTNDDDKFSVRWWFFLVALLIGAVAFIIRAFRPEKIYDDLDADDFVNRQQYALLLWKDRLSAFLLSLVFITITLAVSLDFTPLDVIGIALFFVYLILKNYFNVQIKQAKSLQPDLLLAPRMDVVVTMTPTLRLLERAAMFTVLVAWGAAVWVGLRQLPPVPHHNSLLFWSIIWIVLCPIITASLLGILHKPINVADEDEATEVQHDKWMIPVLSIAINLVVSAVLVLAAVL